MQLIMRRERLNRQLWYKFRINARITLEREDNDLIVKYRLQKVIITPGDMQRDLIRAAIVAALVAFGFFLGTGIDKMIVAFVVVFFLTYHQIREEVRVSDLVTGRNFKARSLLHLLRKEIKIRKTCYIFAKVLEQARTWQEAEVIDITPPELLIPMDVEHAVT